MNLSSCPTCYSSYFILPYIQQAIFTHLLIHLFFCCGATSRCLNLRTSSHRTLTLSGMFFSYCHFTQLETESGVACWGPHSWQGLEPGFEAGSPTLELVLSNPSMMFLLVDNVKLLLCTSKRSWADSVSPSSLSHTAIGSAQSRYNCVCTKRDERDEETSLEREVGGRCRWSHFSQRRFASVAEGSACHAVTGFPCIDIVTIPYICVALCSFHSIFKPISSFYPHNCLAKRQELLSLFADEPTQ